MQQKKSQKLSAFIDDSMEFQSMCKNFDTLNVVKECAKSCAIAHGISS